MSVEDDEKMEMNDATVEIAEQGGMVIESMASDAMVVVLDFAVDNSEVRVSVWLGPKGKEVRRRTCRVWDGDFLVAGLVVDFMDNLVVCFGVCRCVVVDSTMADYG